MDEPLVGGCYVVQGLTGQETSRINGAVVRVIGRSDFPGQAGWRVELLPEYRYCWPFAGFRLPTASLDCRELPQEAL